ncbi:MOSC domain-containing protein [Evansella sp. AB-rgal1]|uniref:MOSC domain-containing protein n=1 Tax=Evansella sp. AB-rgal1 TaxID=3242696 RepID=UPI00359E3CCA
MKSLISLNVGKPQPLSGLGETVTSAMNKKSVSTDVYLYKDCLVGDDQADKKNHGGPEKAVCVYSYDHYPFWEEELEIALPLGAFGENITIHGLKETDVNIGDTFQWGNAIVQVSQPRIPCHKLAKRYEEPKLPKRVIETGYTGFYLRVLKEGSVSVEAPLQLMERKTHFSIKYVNDIFHHDKKNLDAIKELLKIEELANNWKKMLEPRLNKGVTE